MYFITGPLFFIPQTFQMPGSWNLHDFLLVTLAGPQWSVAFCMRQLHKPPRTICPTSLSLSVLRWWRQWRTSIVSPPPSAARLPSTLWCSSAGRQSGGTDSASTPSCPPWTGSSGTLPLWRRSRPGERAPRLTNTSEAAGDVQSAVSHRSHLLTSQELFSDAAQPDAHRLISGGDGQRLAEGVEDGEISGRVRSGSTGHFRQSQHTHHGVSMDGYYCSSQIKGELELVYVLPSICNFLIYENELQAALFINTMMLMWLTVYKMHLNSEPPVSSCETSVRAAVLS